MKDNKNNAKGSLRIFTGFIIILIGSGMLDASTDLLTMKAVVTLLSGVGIILWGVKANNDNEYK